MKPVFIGSGVAIVTPFNKDGKIAFDLFSKLIEFQISNNTDAIIVCGTTGEGSTLTVDERLALFSIAVRQVSGRVPVIGGTGSNSTSFSIDLIKEAEKCGIDAHLSVTPYYNKASQNGIVRHYYELADNAAKPIMVYNVPSRTGVNIQPEIYYKLGQHKNIVAVKEADQNVSKIQKSIACCSGLLDFYVGNDDMIALGGLLGCKGVISVLSNILPYYTHIMSKEAVAGNASKCRKMQYDVLEIVDCLFTDINPIPVKYALEYVYKINSTYRLPLCEMTDEKKSEVETVIDKNRHIFSSEMVKL